MPTDSRSSSAKRSAFVTGAAGFVGRHLVEELVRRGWEVTAFCLPADDADVLRPVAKVVLGDITDADAIRAGMPPAPDAVFHVAGDTTTWSQNAARQYRVNVLGTSNMIEVALQKSARRFVYTSSISAYGYQPGRRLVEDTPSNVLTKGDNYGRTKREAERRIKQAVAESGLSAVILNPVNIVGPYDRTNWTRQLILPLSQGKLRVVPPGAATWAFVLDVVDAQIAAVDSGRSGENYLLGGVQASFAEVVEEIAAILGRRPAERVAPKALLRVALWAAMIKSRLDGKEPALTPPKYRRAVGDLLCDDTLAQQELGYRHTDLTTMLAETIRWLRQEHLLDEYVEVTDEPNHVEQFANEHVRVYLASIEPSSCTLYHHHHVNTLYVVTTGGSFRSKALGRQPQRTGVGRSVGMATKLGWALRRSLSATLRMTTGTMLMQYHGDFPLTHRLCASEGNAEPIRMLGVELRTGIGGSEHPVRLPGLAVEYHDRQATTYRVRLAPGQSTGRIHLDRPGLLVLVKGTGRIRQSTDLLGTGATSWLDRDDLDLGNASQTTTLDALLIALNEPAGSGRSGHPGFVPEEAR